MNKKKLICLLLAAGMILGMTACGTKNETEEGNKAGEILKEEEVDESDEAAGLTEGNWSLDLSTPQPEDCTVGRAIAWFADEVSARTNGMVEVNIFWNGALGAEKDEIVAMAGDEIELNACGTLTVDSYAPEYGFLTAPFLYKDINHFEAVLDSEILDGFKEKLENNNIRVLGLGVRGTRETASNVALNSAEDIKGLVIRMPENATYLKAWDALGASCQILGAGDVYSSLQTKVIQATEGPYEQLLSMSTAEVCDYVVGTDHTYEFLAIYSSDSWFESMPSDIAAIIEETAQEAMDNATAWGIEDNESNKQAMIDAGMTYIEFDNAEALKMLQPVWEEMFETDWTATTYEKIMSYASE